MRSRGERLAGRQSIVEQYRDIQNNQPCTHILTPKASLERPVNITVRVWTMGESQGDMPFSVEKRTGPSC